MANANFKTRQLTYEQEPVQIFGTMIVGQTGAVGTVKGGGVASVTRTTTGGYTITLKESFNHLLQFDANYVATNSGIVATNLSAASVAAMKTDIQAKTVKIQCYSATATPADPVSGSIMVFTICARLSNVGPWD